MLIVLLNLWLWVRLSMESRYLYISCAFFVVGSSQNTDYYPSHLINFILNDHSYKILYMFFTENRLWRFMQTVSFGDHLHEMTKQTFWRNKKKLWKCRLLIVYPACYISVKVIMIIVIWNYRYSAWWRWIPCSRNFRWYHHCGWISSTTCRLLCLQ